MERAIIYADGASLGNPGASAIGAVIKDERGQPVTRISQSIGWATNNQAEYSALIAALKEAIILEVRQIDINLDSELVVRQINGRYRVKSESLKPLYQQSKMLLSQFASYKVTHIPDSRNTEAHNLAHKALE